MQKSVITLLCAATMLAAGCSRKQQDPTQYVDTYIGTGGHGHVFMGANVPFGMVQLGPTSIPQEWDWTSGYHISDTTVIGFAHTHLSGTGIGDLSDISLMPVTGEVTMARGNHDDPQSGMWSYFSRSNERTRPGYYATRLDRYGVDVELTATERVGFHKYTFSATDDARIVIDLENGTCWDEATEGYITRIDDRTISGHRFSTGWADNQKIFFVARFSQPFREIRLFRNGVKTEGSELKAKNVYGQLLFGRQTGEPIYVKVALSPVSGWNAHRNMETELPAWDFDAAVRRAHAKWYNQLSKVSIETQDESVKRIFYTALYHTMIAPSLFCDLNGDYQGADGKTRRKADFVNYTTFSLWDTYRAAHPLMTILHPEMVPDIVNSMINISEQQGKLPVWHLMGCETDCMVGNPAIPVVADAILKGFGGFDVNLAYEAMRRSAMLDERGMELRKKYGYIPYDKYNESVATCMEYAIADHALAQTAEYLGYEEDYNYFLERSLSYRHYFDPSVGFVRGVSSEGTFREDFDPFRSVHRDNDYTEGNAWQYTWLAPHDVEGLVELFGGRERFIEKLDSLFVAEGDLGEEASPDISGLIGQYAHGNEPSHHIAYLYTMTGQPWKTADRVREILATLYHDRPDGLCGNEDAGQMSAWYVLSALGFYQVEPAGGRYYFGSPIVDKASLAVPGGQFDIIAHKNSDRRPYIQSIKLNGEDYRKSYIDFADITKGGTLEFTMGNKPALWYDVE